MTILLHSGEEIGQLETLEGQWRAALDKHKLRKRHVKQLEEDLQVMKIAKPQCVTCTMMPTGNG